MTTKISFIVICFALVLSSCLKPQEFPLEPIIEFDSFSVMRDSAVLTISFTDGDGDIGYKESDTTGNFAPDKLYHHNLFLEYYDLSGNDISFLYRVPYLTPNGNNTALKGKIEVTLEPSYFNPLSSQSDTVMYKITLVDRS